MPPEVPFVGTGGSGDNDDSGGNFCKKLPPGLRLPGIHLPVPIKIPQYRLGKHQSLFFPGKFIYPHSILLSVPQMAFSVDFPAFDNLSLALPNIPVIIFKPLSQSATGFFQL